MIFVEKTLAESAREYQQQHEKKVDMKEVDIKTGEEGESNVLQVILVHLFYCPHFLVIFLSFFSLCIICLSCKDSDTNMD